VTDLLAALGLLLAVEGTLYAAFPGAARNLMRRALETPEAALRAGGLAALVGGVCLVWLARG
jgi:uncharacterized protein YjeT (DUF2065 family)